MSWSSERFHRRLEKVLKTKTLRDVNGNVICPVEQPRNDHANDKQTNERVRTYASGVAANCKRSVVPLISDRQRDAISCAAASCVNISTRKRANRRQVFTQAAHASRTSTQLHNITRGQQLTSRNNTTNEIRAHNNAYRADQTTRNVLNPMKVIRTNPAKSLTSTNHMKSGCKSKSLNTLTCVKCPANTDRGNTERTNANAPQQRVARSKQTNVATASIRSVPGSVPLTTSQQNLRASASSLSSLDTRNNKFVVKLVKSASKEFIPEASNTKNNNYESKRVTSSTYTGERLNTPSDGELAQQLNAVKRELDVITAEKAQMALELQTYKTEVHQLRNDMARLHSDQEQSAAAIEQLNEENAVLRCRLRDVTHSPLSDNEKQYLLDSQRLAPSIHYTQTDCSQPLITSSSLHATSTVTFSTTIATLPNDLASCPSTPDWDKRSQSSLSEVSVACLQDKILQMEETHYSTNEELQATLQELADLQAQLIELQTENERLLDEKNVLLESLCRQTEKLEDSRQTVDTLQDLLIRNNNPDPVASNQTVTNDAKETASPDSDRENKLVELLKTSQEDKEALVTKQSEMLQELHELRQTCAHSQQERERLVDRVRMLETTIDSVHGERKAIDQELAQAREESSARWIEINRLKILWENAKAKVDELENTRANSEQSEMDSMLDAARKEKDTLESLVATLKGEITRAHCDKERLSEQIQMLQEDCKATKTNAKGVINELEYQTSQLKSEVTQLRADLQTAQDALLDAHAQSQRHLEDKRNLKAMLAETQRQLNDSERKCADVDEKWRDEMKLRREENHEWEQFQRDLLMTVRVANDFKTEAQTELEKLVHENKSLRDKVRALESQVEKLKVKPITSPVKPSASPFVNEPVVVAVPANSVFSSMQQEMAVRRQNRCSRQDSRLSVKSLIESIENATKQVKQAPGGESVCSRSSSTSSLNSVSNSPLGSVNSVKSNMLGGTTTTTTLASNVGIATPMTNNSIANNHESWATVSQMFKYPLRETQQMGNGNVGSQKLSRSSSGKNLINAEYILNAKDTLEYARNSSFGDLTERKDPLNGLVKNGGSKRNALLKWCQQKTDGYRHIDITNFSSSWNDGLAFCAILHSYLPERVPYDTLVATEKRRNFSIAFAAAESVGITTTLNINDMCTLERPDWQQVMAYVTAIYKHFET